MTPVELSLAVRRAVGRAARAGELSVTAPERIVVGPPGPGGTGEYATGVALQLARPAGLPPRDVAAVLRRALLAEPGIARVDITGPGFLNLSLTRSGPTALVEAARRPGYGHGDALAGQHVTLRIPRETRAETLADALVRILTTQGADAAIRYGEPATLRPVPPAHDPWPLLGRDAGRWALLRPAAHDRVRLTREHLVQRESNPLFQVRYAHARARALVRNAADLGFAPAPGDPGPAPGDPGPALGPTPERAPRPAPRGPRTPGAAPAHARRTPPTEPTAPGTSAAPVAPDTPGTRAETAALLQALAAHPAVLTAAARHRAPDRVARQLARTADALLAFQTAVAVLPRGGEKPSAAHRARLALAEAAGTVLAGGLSLLGIDAPEHL